MSTKTISGILISLLPFFSYAVSAYAQSAKPLTNADIVEMIKGGLPESTIVLAIQNSQTNFDSSPKALIDLKNQGATPAILDAVAKIVMVKAAPVQSVPIQKVKIAYKLFSFELNFCEIMGTRITCELLVTNQTTERKLGIRKMDSTRMLDSSGNEYKPKYIKFGSNDNDSPSVQLPTGIPFRLIIIFDDIPTTTRDISLLQIFGDFPDQRYDETPNVQFRNIPLKVSTPQSTTETAIAYKGVFSFEPKGCETIGSLLTCAVSVTNNSQQNRRLGIKVSCTDGHTRLIDYNGNEYKAIQGQVGNRLFKDSKFGIKTFLTPCTAEDQINSNSTTLITLSFENGQNVKAVRLLQFDGRFSGEGNNAADDFTVEFEDLHIK